MENVFLSDAELPATVADLKYLRSIAGVAGPPGPSGDTIQNYGGSLLKNGALELGTLEGWTGNIALGEVYKGLMSLSVNDTASSSMFPMNKECILKVSAYVKAANGVPRIAFYSFDYLSNVVQKSNGGVSTFIDFSVTQGVWQKIEYYFAGVGTSINSFAESCKLQAFLTSQNGSSNILYNRLVIKEVEKGEAVPHNLPYLPEGQTVVNNTTGKVGRFNGSTVDWYM